MSDLKEIDLKKMAEELRDKVAWANKNKEAALDEPYYLFFFSAVDPNGRTRFFDIKKQEEGFSLAETAASAPRLGQCVETVYRNASGETHHVHRIYGKYSTTTALDAMQRFAALYGLTQLTEMSETSNQREALPTWELIFAKMGCRATPGNSNPASSHAASDHTKPDAME